MNVELAEVFPAHRASAWSIRMKAPVRDPHRLVVGFNDRHGMNCRVEFYRHSEDPSRIVVSSASGLMLEGSISVSYNPFPQMSCRG